MRLKMAKAVWKVASSCAVIARNHGNRGNKRKCMKDILQPSNIPADKKESF
jgi:hypothetical protein